MPQLLDYPRPLLTTADVMRLTGYSRRTINRLQHERGFPKPSVNPRRPGQRFRASLVDDWLKRQERANGVA